MRKHTRIYLKSFGYSTDYQDERIPCEICNGRVVDIHHIDPRRMGGDKTGEKDRIENLMGLCRSCHDKCERHEISRGMQILAHKQRLLAAGVEFSYRDFPVETEDGG